ncbi:MAG: MBL fold metallo-hydrolase [Syntrophomonadaceae bacterium]|nr:MBL fold metallo-hydrolase [Syntrophomonadaceae bacterium]
MKLTILGCNSPFPNIDDACSGYLLENNDTTILMDCGHSVFAKLKSTKEINQLDAVIISHFHPDHYVDLYAIKYVIRAAMQSGLRSEPLPLFIPNEPHDIFAYWVKSKEFRVTPLEANREYKIKSMQISAYAMKHPLPVWGIKVESENSSIFYTGDTVYDETINLPQNVSLLLGEASFLANDSALAKEAGHMSTLDLANMAGRITPQLLVATHLWPEFSPEQIAGELKELYRGDYAVAKSGKEFVF